MSDQGYDFNEKEMDTRLEDWTERTVEHVLQKHLDYLPDTVGMLACLKYAARKVKLRPDLLTQQMAERIFSNLIEELKPSQSFKA